MPALRVWSATMADSVKVSWSGGKDSTAALLLHLHAGHKVKAVCYVPMFDDQIPLIEKAHYEFIVQTADRFRQMGADVQLVSGMTYFDFVTHVITRGKNKGKIMGFPPYITGMCSFRVYSKHKALNNAQLGTFDYEDIGIAFDEKKRHGQLTASKRSILVERQVTESDAYWICLEEGMLSPTYKQGNKRDGCALCPHAPQARRERWFSDYPAVLPKLAYLQQVVQEQRPEHPPLRGGLYFI